MDFLVGMICLMAGILLLAFRGPLAKASDELDAKAVPWFLRMNPTVNLFFFSLFFIAVGIYVLYKALFEK